MFTTRVVLPTPVAVQDGPEIARRMYFVSSDITGFELIDSDGQIREVVLTSDRPLDATAFEAKVAYLVEHSTANRIATPQKVVWRSHDRRTADGTTFDRLAARGGALRMAPGQVALGEPMLSLMDYLDATLRTRVSATFGAQEYRYPTLISTEILQQCGYFESFPQFVMFVTRLHSDSDVYRRFHDSYRETGVVDGGVLTDCDNVEFCLPPTMCYFTFAQYRGHSLDADAHTVVTSRGKSFRFESRYAEGLERLWDFTIREIVFMGTRSQVLRFREQCMKLAFELVDELGLSGFCEVANDPFFLSPGAADKAWRQRFMELKYELRLHVDDDRTIAAASFNFHDSFFAERFDIRCDDERAYTACAGFGLERLAYAFLCQFGPDPDGWPAAVRSALTRPEPHDAVPAAAVPIQGEQ